MIIKIQIPIKQYKIIPLKILQKYPLHDAKNIAQKFIEEPGATAGEPMLKNDDGTQVYIVPIMHNNNIVGEILIDAQTGENLGGAGGVSNTTK